MFNYNDEVWVITEDLNVEKRYVYRYSIVNTEPAEVLLNPKPNLPSSSDYGEWYNINQIFSTKLDALDIARYLNQDKEIQIREQLKKCIEHSNYLNEELVSLIYGDLK